jgi:hypothetical protein
MGRTEPCTDVQALQAAGIIDKQSVMRYIHSGCDLFDHDGQSNSESAMKLIALVFGRS